MTPTPRSEGEERCPTCKRVLSDLGGANCEDPFHADPQPEERWTGEMLYHEWCGSKVTDRALYWHSMNPASKRDWERLATVFNDREQEVKRLREALLIILHRAKRGSVISDVARAALQPKESE